MNSINKVLKDSMMISKDSLAYTSHPRTLWARTQITGGYGIHKNEYGISELDETCFGEENIVPIGGVQFAMEQLFGITGSLNIPKLNDFMQIGAQGSTVSPSGNMPHPYGQKVCLFGVGTGGAAENNLTIIENKYNEYTIPTMIPLRFTADALSATDAVKYFGKKIIDDSTAYYLKAFDSNPTVHHLYKNGEDGEDGSEVTNSVFQTYNEVGIESFTEICLTISKKDVKEWFVHNGNIEDSRVNSIGLFTAVYDAEQKDYANIQLFSVFNMASEPLSMVKDLNIIYRVYGA